MLMSAEFAINNGTYWRWKGRPFLLLLSKLASAMWPLISEVSTFLHSMHFFTCVSNQFNLRGGIFMSSTYDYASREVEAALLQESFPHSIVSDTEDDPVSQQTILQAIAEISRFLKKFKCGNVGIDCFFAHLSTGIEFVTFKCLLCYVQMSPLFAPKCARTVFYYFIYSVSVFRVTGIVYLQTFDSHCSNEERFNKLRRARFALDVGDNSVVLP